MAAKTTSGSGFDFGFVFYALDLVGNEYKLENIRGTLFEIFGVKFEKFENLLIFSKIRAQMADKYCSIFGPLALCQILSDFNER